MKLTKEIIDAAVAGKKIQFRILGYGDWRNYHMDHTISDVLLDIASDTGDWHEYRVKPAMKQITYRNYIDVSGKVGVYVESQYDITLRPIQTWLGDAITLAVEIPE